MHPIQGHESLAEVSIAKCFEIYIWNHMIVDVIICLDSKLFLTFSFKSLEVPE